MPRTNTGGKRAGAGRRPGSSFTGLVPVGADMGDPPKEISRNLNPAQHDQKSGVKELGHKQAAAVELMLRGQKLVKIAGELDIRPETLTAWQK